ncbi:voltage-gated potassium channel [Lentinus tigrinus ALCF2SS1-7]|uniref:Voltage-gated potassium channel n=1 Tax=Lentinus tigrinus ALCF2SS1-6 TaxID=1328759 RepID=A0A5C2SHE1_9APHY|nr:voltage-gated potassium channel [Lentinus tigrinus ALCF2SS1-6]RPD77539.1 voltage-gated potassium channel [Lentinus tigrinus ALCF2SS1-7]
MSQPIPLSQISTTSASSPFVASHTSPQEPEYQNGLAYDHEDEAKRMPPSWQKDVYMLLEQPTSSQAAFLVHFFTTSLIVFSAVVTVLETVPAFHSISGGVWFGLETTLVVLFTIEYIGRCVAHATSWKRFFRWVISFFGVIDLLGILPYYIEIAMQQDTSTLFRFTILRTFRLLRVFRPFRYNNTILLTIEVMYLSFRRSQHALLALAFFVVMVLIVFSTLLYFAERGTWDETIGVFLNSDGDPSQFASIPAAGWFVLVTITTVGYGEITPRSFLGRLITLPLLVFGLLLIALPTFVLGREFSIVWESMEEAQRARDGDENSDPFNDPTTSPLLSSRRTRDFAASSTSLWRTTAEEVTRPRPNRVASNTSIRPPVPTQSEAELSAQITELRAKVEMQEEMLRRIMYAVEGRGYDASAQRRAEAVGSPSQEGSRTR